MNKLFAFVGATVGGWIGWWIGEQVGFMTAFMLSIIGTAVGIYYSRKMAKENYPDDPRGPSCLVMGYGEFGVPVHVVCGSTKHGTLRIITVYVPTAPKWIDERTRRKI